MRTITRITTELTNEEIFQKMHVLMVNNKFALVPNQQEWNRGDGSFMALQGFSFRLEGNVITIESWIGDTMVGEHGIEKGMYQAVVKVRMRAILDVIINTLKSPNSTIEGYIPVTNGKAKVNANSDTMEREIKVVDKNVANIATSSIALVFAFLAWILIFSTGKLYIYWPIMSIVFSVYAIIGNNKTIQRGEKSSPLVIVFAIIAIIIAVLSFLFLFL